MSLVDLIRAAPASDLALTARALPDEDLAALLRELPGWRLAQLVSQSERAVDAFGREFEAAAKVEPPRFDVARLKGAKPPKAKWAPGVLLERIRSELTQSMTVRELASKVGATPQECGGALQSLIVKGLIKVEKGLPGERMIVLSSPRERASKKRASKKSAADSEGPPVGTVHALRPFSVSEETSARRAALVAWVLERGVVESDSIPKLAGSHTMDDLLALIRRGELHRRNGLVAVDPSRLPPLPPESERRRLPMLELGNGDRRNECVQYNGCLSRFDRAHPRAESAQCPPSCAQFEAMPAYVRQAMAHGNVALTKAVTDWGFRI